MSARIGKVLRMTGVAGALALLAGCNPSDNAAAPQPEPPTVTVAAVMQKDVRRSAQFIGQVQAVDDVQVLARVSGFLEAKHVADGATVKKGDPLFTIEKASYAAAVASAQADLANARADAALKAADLERDSDLFQKGGTSPRPSSTRPRRPRSRPMPMRTRPPRGSGRRSSISATPRSSRPSTARSAARPSASAMSSARPRGRSPGSSARARSMSISPSARRSSSTRCGSAAGPATSWSATCPMSA